MTGYSRAGFPRILTTLFALAAALALTSPGARAQDFPTKPVRIVVPQTPGGASDALARIVAQKLQEKWGQPVVVENKAGAGGNIGMEAVAVAPPDGYTMLMSYVGTHAINGALYKKLPFDPVRDFTPLATIGTLPFVAVAKNGAAFQNVQQLVAAAGKGRLTFGSAGNGSVNHLLGEMFNAATGVKLVHVPYRGAAPALQDLLGGQIDLVFTSLPSVAGQIKQGIVQPIAVTSAARASLFPSIPTLAESGVRDFDVTPWFGLFGPGRMPAAVVRRINTDVAEILRSKDVVDKLAQQGADPLITEPQKFADILKADIDKWGQVVRASGASVD